MKDIKNELFLHKFLMIKPSTNHISSKTYYASTVPRTMGQQERCKMSQQCIECGGTLNVPKEGEKGDIFSCPDCGVDYVIEIDEDGKKKIKELNLEEEDWGE